MIVAAVKKKNICHELNVPSAVSTSFGTNSNASHPATTMPNAMIVPRKPDSRMIRAVSPR